MSCVFIRSCPSVLPPDVVPVCSSGIPSSLTSPASLCSDVCCSCGPCCCLPTYTISTISSKIIAVFGFLIAFVSNNFSYIKIDVSDSVPTAVNHHVLLQFLQMWDFYDTSGYMTSVRFCLHPSLVLHESVLYVTFSWFIVNLLLLICGCVHITK